MPVILKIAYKLLLEMRIYSSNFLKSTNIETQKSFPFEREEI